MSVKDGRDYIYLIWKDVNTRRQYNVGQLSKNGQFEFNYGFEIEKALKKGFDLLIPFGDINKIYKSDILFPVFSSRLPDKKRKDMDKILEKYGMATYDDYTLLKRSGARLPIDNLGFIDPILDKDSEIKRIFDLSGSRHYIGCKGQNCDDSINLSIDEELKLVLEPDNSYDKNAIKVSIISNDVHIGYVPRYYSKEVSELINDGYDYTCKVFDVQKDNNCNECIKIELVIRK